MFVDEDIEKKVIIGVCVWRKNYLRYNNNNKNNNNNNNNNKHI